MTTANEPLHPHVAAVLRSIVGERKLNKTAIAREAGISRESVLRYLDGVRAPTIDQLAAITSAMGISLSDVLAAAERRRSRERLSVVPDMTGWENEEGVAAEPRRPGEVIGDDGEFTF